jgi:UDP-glucose 4-epimerase
MKKFIITGGTGFMGQNIINELVRSYPDCKIVSISRTWDRMRGVSSPQNVKYIYGDVTNLDDLSRAFSELEGMIDCVFHCAAFKDVVAGENNVPYLTRINVDGSNNVIRKAIDFLAQKVVLISTDKAVEPKNSYGHTKALMESLVRQYRHKIDICFVRYGNVWASTGSVGDVWYKKSRVPGSVLLITDPEMTRFWLSKKDAWDLIEYAYLHGKSGWGYVPYAKSSTMEQVAKVFIGMYPNIVDVKVVGAKEGEKMHEAMIGYTEPVVPKLNDGIGVYGIPPRGITGMEFVNLTSDTTEQMTDDEVLEMVRSNDRYYS